MEILTPRQRSALEYVDCQSGGVRHIDRSLRITINFHPDRIYNGTHILESLADSRIYKSQFETNTSNGGLTAHYGGDRWNWESYMFFGAYDSAPPRERPKYGALNYRRTEYGSSPRFGSSYFRLTVGVLDRATFCYPDSVYQPTMFGTAQHMNLIEIASSQPSQDYLDDYIEAHIHGSLRISSEDIEAVVLDPSYKGSSTEDLARKLGCPVEWHEGFSLSVTEMERHPDYRGSHFIDLGREIAVDGILTPIIIGNAVNSGQYELQDLKKVWHYVANFGRHKSF